MIGTCAPVSELRRIYRKVNGSPADAISDYQIHNLFVRSAAGEHDGIKQLQRYLDTRYRSTIRRFGKVKDAQVLGELWRFSVDSGEVAAGYWALTTHPMITDSLNAEAFGEVHMLSHLAGRTWQQESSRRKEAESRLQEKLQKLRQVESALNQARKHLDRQTTSVGRMEMKIIQQEETISRLESRVQSLIKPGSPKPRRKPSRHSGQKSESWNGQQRPGTTTTNTKRLKLVSGCLQPRKTLCRKIAHSKHNWPTCWVHGARQNVKNPRATP